MVSKLSSCDKMLSGESKGQYFVKTVTGKTITVDDVDILVDKVERLMDGVNSKLSIPSDQFRLLYCGKTLDRKDTLLYHNIQPGSTVHLTLNLRGGMLHTTSGRLDYEELANVKSDIQVMTNDNEKVLLKGVAGDVTGEQLIRMTMEKLDEKKLHALVDEKNEDELHAFVNGKNEEELRDLAMRCLRATKRLRNDDGDAEDGATKRLREDDGARV